MARIEGIQDMTSPLNQEMVCPYNQKQLFNYNMDSLEIHFKL